MGELILPFECNNGSPFAFDAVHDLFTDGHTLIIAAASGDSRPPPVTEKILKSDPVVGLLFSAAPWTSHQYTDLLARLAPYISETSNENRRVLIGGCQFDALKVWDALLSVRALDSTVIEWRITKDEYMHILQLRASLWQAMIMGMRHTTECKVTVVP